MVELMWAQCDDLRYVKLFEHTGHWLQQERPAEVNVVLVEFLRGLPAGCPTRCHTGIELPTAVFAARRRGHRIKLATSVVGPEPSIG